MRSCYDVMAEAVRLYQDRERYIYFYGAKCYYLDDATMDNLIAAEPGYFSRYTPEEIGIFKDLSRGKYGLDCSGFVNLCTGQYNYSTGYISEALNVTTPDKGTWGNILYTTFGHTGRHIGIDIGAGRFLHIGTMGETIEFGLIKDFAWELSGQVKGIDYYLTSDK